jgi:hypothetical protein
MTGTGRTLTQRIDFQSAAIVCSYIATEGKPIRLAVRGDPVDDADSGWQFLCGDKEEDQAQLWSVREVLELEPTFEFVHCSARREDFDS